MRETLATKRQAQADSKTAQFAALRLNRTGTARRESSLADMVRQQSTPALMRSPASTLSINQPGDRYEQEADRVADQVMRMPASDSVQFSNTASSGQRLQRACAHCEEEDKNKVHRKETGAGPAAAPPIVHEVLGSPGQPLDAGTRAFMEPRFGHDFGAVRVHTDAKAASSARLVNASAYTVGNDIVFDHSRFNSGSATGRRLLAHELTHVVQQSGSAQPMLSRAPAEPEQKDKIPASKPKAPQCDTGCAQRWGKETTCSKWGYVESTAERGEGKKWRSFSCCNTWPLSVETYARNQLGIQGAASCTARHEREIATVTMGDQEVQVLCSDTISPAHFGGTEKAGDCSGKIDKEVIELSPKAMQDLSGQLANALHVKVCYSGSKEDLCLHNGPGADKFPKITDCLTRGCGPIDGAPSHTDSGWPRV